MTTLQTLAAAMPTNILDPQWWFDNYGSQFFIISCVIVFVECGLFFPFLPGDSLLFAIGLFITGGQLDVNIGVALVILTVAALLGNIVGYEIGRKLGPALLQREGRIIKRKYFEQSAAFFDKHGSKALVIGRFVPIVRTFVTIVAGVSAMDRRKFITWSAVGAVLWVGSITLAGYFLGQAFPALGKNIDKAVIVIVIVSVLPMIYEYLKHRREAKGAAASEDTARD